MLNPYPWVIVRRGARGLEALTGLPDDPSGWVTEVREITLLFETSREAWRYARALGLDDDAVDVRQIQPPDVPRTPAAFEAMARGLDALRVLVVGGA